MLEATAFPTRQRTFPLALALGLGVALLGVGTALAATGGDWQAMLEACQQAMAAMGIQVTPEQMRALMAGCMGR